MPDTHAPSTDHLEQPTESNDPTTVSRSLRTGVVLLITAGALFVIHGFGFIFRTIYTDGFELGVDRLDGVTASELAATHPEVASYIDHLHISFAGLLIAVGFGMAMLAWFGVANRQRWAFGTAVALPLMFGAISLPIHQGVHFHFDTLIHLGPAALGLPVLVLGALLGYRGLSETDD